MLNGQIKNFFILSLLLSVIDINTCRSQVYFNVDDNLLYLGNNCLEIQIRKDDGTIWSIFNKLNHTELKTEKDNSWHVTWSIEVLMPDNSLHYSDSKTCSEFNYEVTQNDNEILLILIWKYFAFKDTWETYNAEIIGEIVVKLADPFSYWSVKGINNGPGTVYSIGYPFITGIKWLGDNKSDDYLVYPSREGLLFNNFWDNWRNRGWNMTYPSGYMSMQFTAYYDDEKNGGFYLSTKDNECFIKGFSFDHTQDDFIFWSLTHYPEVTTDNGFQLSYPIILGVFQGDWMTAADLYKEWAYKQWWTTLSIQEKDTPNWLFNLSAMNQYICHADENRNHYSFDQFAEITINHSKAFPDYNMGELWGWEKSGLWSGWGDYFPPYEGWQSFDAMINKLHESDSKLRLFINAVGIHKYTDTWVNENPSQYAVKNIDSSICISTSDGLAYIPGDIATMCISTDYWKNKLLNITNTLADHKVDMIQLDCWPIGKPESCYSLEHGHEFCYRGNWYVNSWVAALQSIRDQARLKHGDVSFCTEYIAETYIPYLDCYHSRDSWGDYNSSTEDPEVIPLFPYVYHDKIMSIAQLNLGLWNFLDVEYNLLGISRILNWGGIPNYNFRENIESGVLDVASFNFLKKVVNVRNKFKEWLVFGKMIRPPEIESPEINIQLNNGSIKANALQYSAWETLLGEKAYFFSNICSSPVDFNFLANTYSLNQTDILVLDEYGSVTSINNDIVSFPDKIVLDQNYPNPFNQTTVINFSLPSNEFITLKIYNVNGQEISTLVNGLKQRGSYSVRFDGNQLNSGVYIYRLSSSNIQISKKILLIK